MQDIKINGTDSIQVSGFDIRVIDASGNVTVYEGGLQDLLRGKLSFTSDDGSRISNSAILSGINLDGMSGHIIPEVISNDKNKENKKTSHNTKEKTKEQLEEIQKQLAELKELKKKLEEEQKEKSEAEEEQQPVNENVELLNQMIAQLSAQAPMQAMQQEQMSEEEVNDNTSTKKADSDAISMSSSSGSSNAPADAEVPAEDQDKSDIFVEVKLSNRSDSGDKGDFITNANKPTFELTTLPEATVSIEINGVIYETKADSNGAAIISITEELADGEYSIKVEAKDEAGNVATVNQQLVIDTVAPEITFDLATDSGVSDADGLTNVNKPTFTGSISGDPVSVYIQVGDVKYDLSAKNGQFSFTFPIEFPDGEYEFTLHAVDSAGNESVIPQKVTIDTVNDFKVSMSDISDSGVKGDWITNSDKPVFRFDHEPNSTIQVIYNDQVINVDSQNSPTIFQFDQPLEEGEHIITFVSTDAAGNKSEITQTVVIDQTAPDFSIEGLTNEADTGNDGDNITADNTPTFHGKAEAGSTVYLEIDGDVYEAVVGENGRWSIDVTNELKDGNYTVVSYAKDAAGNVSEKAVTNVTIDTIGPEITGGFDESTDTGSSTKDGITNSEKLVFKGTTDAYAKVTLTIESLGITQEVTANANGEWSFELTDVPEGSYSYVISAFDLAGNASIKNIEGTVVVDRSITDFSANMSAETDSGESQEDALTNSKTPTFIGTAEPGSKVQVTIRSEGDGKELPTYAPVTVGADGKWSYTVPDALEDGKYTVSFNVTDLAGNEKTVELPIEIDTQISLTAQFDTHSDSGDRNDSITNIATPKIQGTADAGALIKLTLTHAESGKQIELETRANASGQWSITVPKEFALADQGEWSWTVNATDVAGNKAEPVEGKFTFDNVPPEVSVELASETGFNPTHTNDKNLDLAITTEPGTKVSVTVYKVEKGGVISSTPSYSTENPVVVGENGQLSYAVKDLADGEYVYQVTVTDVAGNVTKTEQQSVTIDTKVPELGNITLTDSSDSNINSDGITNVNALSLKGVGSEVGSRIYFTVENKKTGEKVTLEPDFIEVNSTNWVYKLPAELADGDYDISFFAVDSAGNQSPEKSIDVTVDTVAPEISGVALKAESDTGANNDDLITKEKSPVFVGNAEKGSDITIAIYRGETLVKTVTTKVTSEDGRWEVKVDGLNDGDYKWVVSAKDLAGNETVLNDANQTLKIDTAYVGASGKLDDETNSGSQADNITNVRDAKLSGKGEPGSNVKLLNLTGPDGKAIDVSAVKAVTINEAGEWALDLPTLANGDGKYSWTVELTDIAGNVTTVSGNIVLDTETTVTASLESDYGHSAVDGITNDATPTFAGTAEKGSTVELIILDSNNQKVEGIPTTVVGADGTWKITAPELTLQGEYTWYAKVTDVAGNTASTKESKFTLDTSAPIIVDAKLDPASDAGFESEIPQTNVDTPTFTGQTSEGLASVVVKLYKVTNGVPNGVAAYTSDVVTADEDGFFKVQMTTAVAEGEYVWVVEATDVAGNKAVSQQQPLIIDKTNPSLSEVKLSEESDTSLEPGTNYSNDNTPTLVGKAEPGSRVSISLKKADGSSVELKPDFVVVKPDGTWSFTPITAIEDGEYTWTAQAMDAAGNITISEEIALNIDTKDPVLSDVRLDSSSDSGSNTDDSITNDTTPTFSGVAEKGNKIELKLFDSNNPSAPAYVFTTTVTDNNGSWTINTSALPEGAYSWTVVAIDAAGNTTEHNSEKNVIIDTSIDQFTVGLDAATDSGDRNDDAITNQKQITLSGKGEVGATVKLTSLVNKTTGEEVSLTGDLTVTVDEDGNWALNAPALGKDGTYEWTVELVDIAGNKSEETGSFELDTTIAVEGRLDAESDSGASDDDNITNNTKPVFSGTGTDGDKIKVTLTGPDGYRHVMETTVVNGTWQVTVDPALANDGQYVWVVESTDIAGNTARDEGKFTLDTQAPSVNVSLENDSGINAKDGITNEDELQIKAVTSGGASKVELVVWKKGELTEKAFTATHDFTGDSKEHTFHVSHLEDGEYEYQIIVTDVAGNVAKSDVQQVTIDTVAPDIGEVSLENTQNETYVSDASLSFTGTAEEGSRIYLTLTDSAGQPVDIQPAYVQVNSDGSWTYNLSKQTADALEDGTYTWSFVAEDVAGNRSDAKTGTVNLDTKGPEVTFEGITEDTDTGSVRDDMLTNNEKPVFTGTVSEASKITVTLTPANGGNSYTFTTSEYVNGHWSITPNVDLADGQYMVTITATDMAGNVSNAVVSEKPLVIDTDVSGGEVFGLTQDTDSGIDGDNITNQQSLKLSGNVEPGTTVTLIGLKKPNGESITVGQVSAVAREDGSWELSIPNFGTDNGEYTYTLQYTDAAGNVKEVEGHFTFDNQIDLSAKFASETGKDQDVIYTNNKQPVINGTGNAGDKITVVINGPAGSQTLTTEVGTDGQWTITANELDEDGEYTWKVTATDAAGNTKEVNGEFTLDTEAPSAEVTLENDTGFESNDGLTSEKALKLKVDTSGATKVQLLVWKTGSEKSPVVNETVDLNDQSSHTFTTTALDDGSYQYKVVVTDIAGNTAESKVGSVTVDTTAPEIQNVVVNGVENQYFLNDSALSFSGSAEKGARISLTLTKKNGEEIEVRPAYVEVNKQGKWTYTLDPEIASQLADGEYTWAFVATDAAGNQSEAVTGPIVIDKTAPELTVEGLTTESDSGVQDDNITNNSQPTLTGTVGEYAKIKVVITPVNGGRPYTYETDDFVNGEWALKVGDELAEGQYTIEITATDLAGNESPVKSSNLTIDKTVQGGEEGTFGLADESDSGSSQDDNLTNKTDLKLSGKVEAGTTVSLVSLTGPGSQSIAVENISVTADKHGNWTLNLPMIGGENGVYSYTLKYVDVAGNVKEVNGQFTFDDKIDLEATFASQTGKDQDVIYTNNNQPVINGKGNAGDKITVVITGPAGIQQTLTTEVAQNGEWSVTAKELTEDGEYTWTVTATDAAGNTKDVEGSFTLDTQAPSAEVSLENDTGFDNGDGLTNQKSLQLKVDTTGAAKVQLLVWKVGSQGSPVVDETVSLNGKESHLFTTKELEDGNYQYKVIVTDIAGNTAESTVGAVTVDTSVPAIDDIIVHGVENQYFTSDSALSFSGSAEQGSRITLTLTKKDGEKVVVSPEYVEVNAQGQWTYKLDADIAAKLADGEYTWSFVATDAAGNESKAVTGPIVIDKTEPTLTVEGITEASDSGVKDDNITNHEQPTFTGTVSEYAKIKIVITPVNGGAAHTYETADFVNGKWQLQVGNALPEGEYSVAITATDLAGNESPVENSNLVIDKTVEGGDTGSFGLADESDSGSSQDDNLTNQTALKLNGKVEAGTTVSLVSLTGPNNQTIPVGDISVKADEHGNWTLNLPTLNGDNGVYRYTLKYVDIAGNVKTVDGQLTFDNKIDLDATFDSETGQHQNVIYTNNNQPVIKGTGNAGDKITVVIHGPAGSQTIETEVGRNGEWSVQADVLAEDGVYTWEVTATDAAGNTKEETGSFTLDTQASSVKVTLENDTGLDKKDGITNSDQLQIKAVATGNAAKVELQVWKKGESSVNVFTQSYEFNGTEKEHTFQVSHLDDGEYEYRVIVTDVAGNVANSDVQQVTIDTVAPNLSSVSLENTENDNYIKDASLSFTGTAEKGSRVYLTLKNSLGEKVEVQPEFVQVNDNGTWTYNLSEETAKALKDGEYSWSFVAEDTAGNRSPEQTGTFNLDTKGPEVTFGGITDETDTGNDTDDMVTKNDQPVFAGTVTESSKITVTLTPVKGGESYTFTTQTYVNGNWTITPDVKLAEGKYTVTVTATDMAGNTSASVVSQKPLVIDTHVEGGEQFGLTQDTDTGTAGDNITNKQTIKLSGNVEPGTKVTLTSLTNPNGEAVQIGEVSVVANSDGSWSLSIPAFGDVNGKYTYKLQYEDAAGNIKEVDGHFVFDNKIDLTAEFASETGTAKDIVYTNIKQPVIKGTGNAGDKITVVIEGPAGTQTLTTTVGDDGNWSVTANEINHDGAYTWKVTATDVAGNTTEVNGSFMLDTLAPTAEVSLVNDTGFESNDGITNKKALELKVDTSGAVKVQLLVWKAGTTDTTVVDQTIALNGQASYTFTTDELADGNYQYKVVVTDIAGNTAESEVGAVTVDTAAPDVPEVEVNGVENQYFAKDAALSFSGSAEAGSRISLTLMTKDGVKVDVSPAYVEVDEHGQWTYTLNSASASKLADGEYVWSFVVTDAAGNQSDAVSGPIVIDKTAPVLTVEGITDATDSGVENDNITNNTQPTFTGNVGEYAKIKIVITPVNGGASHTYETAGFVNGKWELQVGNALTEGQYTIAITATDLAGNESPVQNSTLTIDTTVQGGDAGSFGLADESDSGISQDDNLTNKTDLKLSGKVEAGTKVTLVSLIGPDNQPVDINNITTDADSNGDWTLELPTLKGVNGVYSYTLKYVDVAGNEKEVKGQFTFDNEINVTGQFDSQTGAADDIVYTNDNTPAFSGSGTKGDVIRLTITNSNGYNETFNATVGENGQWSIVSGQLPEDGEYSWSIVATDAAGNRQENINGTFTLDTTAPEIEEVGLDANSDTGFSANDGITSDNTPSFVVKGEPGSKVVLKLWSGTSTVGAAKWTSQEVTIPESGQVAIPHASTLADGTYSWTVTLTDIAGNETVSAVQTLKVDTQAPAGGAFDLGSDSGSSQTDNITNVKAPLFTGTGAEAGARVYLTIKNAQGAPVTVEPDYVTVGENGSWSYQLTNQLIDGKYTVQAHVVDAAGNVSSLTEQNLEIDTVAPVVSDVSLTENSDSGQNKADNITNVKNPAFTGVSEKEATIRLEIIKNGQTLHTLTTVVTDESGRWTISNVPELDDGQYTWRVTATDVAGNVSEAETGSVTIDTTIDRFTVELAQDDDTGHANNDSITNQKDVVIRGTAEAGAKVTLKGLKFGEEDINVTSVAAVSVVNGQWSINLPLLDKGDGTYTYTVEIEDIAGNKKELTGTIVLDTDLPELTASLASESDSGSANNDGITNNKLPVFKGSVDEQSKVKLEIFKNGSRVDVYGPVQANGEWTINVTKPLADGEYTWKVTAEDVAGNTHVVQNNITIDTTPPTLTARLDADSDTGASNSDGITKDQSLTIKGTVGGAGKHDVKVRLEFGLQNGEKQTQEVSVRDGEYSFNVNATTDGTYSWKVIAIDVAGNESVKTGTIVVDTQLRDFSQDTGLANESDSGSSQDDNISNDRTPTFSGTTEPNAKVILTLQLKNGTGTPVVVEAQANNQGHFTITVPGNKQLAADGVYTWTMVAEDLAGNEKTVTGEYTLDTTPPAITFDMNDDTGKDGDWITKDKTLSINGTTNDSNASIKVTIMSGGTVVDTQTVQATGGNWSYNYATELQDGTYTVKVESTDVAGNTYVSEKTLVVDTQIVNEFELTSDSGALDDDRLTNAEHLEFSGQTDKDATLELVVKSEDGRDVLHTYRPEVNPTTGQWSFELPDVLAEGKYVIVVTATDVAGNTNTSEDYKVEIDRTPPTLSDITMDSNDDTGVIGDWITETHQISISGQTAIGATVKILISGVNQTITAGVAADGKFTAELPRLEFGDYTLTIIATDAAGNATQHEQKLSVSPNVLPFVVGIEDNSDSGVKGDNITNVTKPVISGAGTPGFKVEATINGQQYTATIDSKGQWKFQLNQALTDGTHTIHFVVKDASGNQVEVKDYHFTVDTSVTTTIALDDSTDTGVKGDFITNAQNVYLTGVSEPGVTVVIKEKESGRVVTEFVTTGQGWGYMLTGLGEGTHDFVIELTDKAGNTSSHETSVTVDRSAPELTVKVDGQDDNSIVTNKTQHTFSGTVEAGVHSLVLIVNGKEHKITPKENGEWSIRLDLQEGFNNYTVKATDVAGNVTTNQGIINIKTSIRFTMEVENDNGQFATDKILNGNKVVVGGSGSPGDVVTLVLTDSQGQRTTHEFTVNDSGRWSHEFTGLNDGTYTVHATIRDDAGNVAEREIDEIVIDNTNANFDASLVDEDGATDDRVVADKQPTFSGRGEVGAEVVLVINDVTYTTKVSSTGTWQFQLPTALTDGDYTATIHSVDLAGNRSQTQTIEFKVDSTAAVVEHRIEGVYENNGKQYVNSEQGKLVFKGTASEAGKIILQINNQEFTQVLEQGGEWTIDVGNIIEREHSYTLIFEDVAGNRTTHTGEVIVDKTINAFVGLSWDSDTYGTDSQTFDGRTKDKSLRFEFNRNTSTTDKDVIATVKVTGPDGTSHTYTNIQTSKGHWDMPHQLTGGDGQYKFEWSFVDAAGNTKNSTMHVTLDTKIEKMDIEDINIHGGNNLVEGEKLFTNKESLSMTFRPGTSEYVKVAVVIDDMTFNAVRSNGGFTFYGIPLKEGSNTLTFKAWDAAGNVTTITHTVVQKTEINIEEFSIEGHQQENVDNIGDFYSNDKDKTISLAGKVDAGSSFTIFVNGKEVHSAEVGEDGSWKHDLVLEEGTNRIQINFVDAAGNEKVVSFNSVIDTVAPIITVDSIAENDSEPSNDNDKDNVVTKDSITLSGRIDNGSTITQITVNGVVIDNLGKALTFDGGKWTIAVEGLKEGDNTIVISAVDKAGNTYDHTMTVVMDSKVTDLTATVSEDQSAIVGTVEAGSKVVVEFTKANTTEKSAETVQVEAVVDSKGNWTAELPEELTEGEWSWTVTATDAAGNTATKQSESNIVVGGNTGGTGDNGSGTPEDENEAVTLPSFPDQEDEVTPSLPEHDAVILPSFPDREPEVLPELKNSDKEVNAPINEETAQTVKNIDNQGEKVSEDEGSLLFTQELIETKVFSGESMPDTSVTLEISGKVYETDADEDGDWLIKAEFSSQGAYDYQLTYTDLNGEVKVETGSVDIKQVNLDMNEAANQAESDAAATESASSSNMATADYASSYSHDWSVPNHDYY